MKAGGKYIVDPALLVREMRPSTLGLWMAMAAIDPWDENRADFRAALIASSAVNAQGCKNASGEHFTARDFTPYLDAQFDPEEVERARQARVSAQLRAELMNVDGHKAQVN